MVGLLLGHGAEAAQIGLQVGHQERGGDPFAGDVCDDEAEATFAEVEEVVIVVADLTSLDCTCLAISSSCAARRSASCFSATTRRCASMAWVSSSKLTSEKELPSISRKRAKTPPQIDVSSPRSIPVEPEAGADAPQAASGAAGSR